MTDVIIKISTEKIKPTSIYLLCYLYWLDNTGSMKSAPLSCS